MRERLAPITDLNFVGFADNPMIPPISSLGSGAGVQVSPDSNTKNRDPGLTLCLSGGGFRATLFHLGGLRRLNELGVLPNVKVISSVSGGSILNGILATRWGELTLSADGAFTNFDDMVATPVRRFCGRDLRTRLLLGVRINLVNLPVLLRGLGSVPANFLAEAYDPHMKRARLADLPPPGDGVPRFIFCATCVQTGACWHFHSGPEARMGDFYTSYCGVGNVKVSEAVAVSSSFPPGFGALGLRLPKDLKLTRIDPWGEERPIPAKRKSLPSRDKCLILLSDGGVYDNLGVEPVWDRSQTLLVSDAGRPFESIPSIHQAIVPRLNRAFEVSAEQVGAVRKRWLIDQFELGKCIGKLREIYPKLNEHPETAKGLQARAGTLWAINTRLKDFQLDGARGYGEVTRILFSEIRTDLNAFSQGEIACLENHGYSLADAALRKYAEALCSKRAADFCWPPDDWRSDDAAELALVNSDKRRLLRDLWMTLIGLVRG